MMQSKQLNGKSARRDVPRGNFLKEVGSMSTVLAGALGLMMLAGAAFADDGYILGSEPDCTTPTGNPGYTCNDQCVLVTVPVLTPPPGYTGDYYVEEFTDAKIRNQSLPPGALPVVYATSLMNTQYRVTISQMVAEGEITEIPADTPQTGPMGWGTPFSPYYWQDFFSPERMRRPSFFYDEDISTLDSRAYLVEFTVSDYVYPGPLQWGTLKLRAWYIKYTGSDYSNPSEVPLIVVTHGGSGEVTMTPAPSFSIVAERDREVAYRMAEVGHVLYWDRRGSGVSEGRVSLDNDINAMDVFEMLEQLHTGLDPAGVPLKIITPDGTSLTGQDAADEIGLANTAKQTKFLHVGGSFGSMIGAKVASLWATDANYGQYNFKGLINWSDISSQGGFSPFIDSRWIVDGDIVHYPIFVAGEKYIRNEYGASFIPDSSALASIDRWPAFFTSGGIQDYQYAAPAGLVEYYNRAQGFKKIRLIIGTHGTPSYPEGEWELLVDDMVNFALIAVVMPPGVKGFKQQTQLKKEVCMANRRVLGIPVVEPPLYPRP